MHVLEDAARHAPPPVPDPRREPLVWLARALLVALLVLVGVWTVRRTTWYLAIDQFGYLTFAEDLAQGRALHEWDLMLPLMTFLPPGADVDVYAQTYVRHGDRLFCRYSPGFPLLLALVRVTLGPEAQHFVNPAVLLLLLACLYVIGRRTLRSEWLGLAAALLGALLPNYVLLWSTSPLRDVPAHLFALAGLAVLLAARPRPSRGGHEAVAGLLLGFAMSTRIDALLYLIPAAGIALSARAAIVRRLVLGILGLSIGIAPLLAYNYVATGNPLRPTQGMEVDAVMSRAPATPPSEAPGWSWPLVAEAVAAESPAPRPTPALVQGGGLRVSNLARTLPANLVVLREALGDFAIVLGVVGAIVAWRTPLLFVLTVPYVIVSVLFFSLWTLPGPRYLAGVMLLFPLLVLEGARFLGVLPAVLSARGRKSASLVAAAVVVLGAALGASATSFDAPSALPWVNVALAVAIAGAALIGVRANERAARFATVGLGIALAVVLAWRASSGLAGKASFQRAQVERARSTIEQALEGRPVVITTTEIGRPAENLNYYTAANALYLEEILRWRAPVQYMMARLLRLGFSVYVLLPAEYARSWLASPYISPWYATEVHEIPAAQAIDYFVASPYHRGVELWLVRMRLKDEPR